jgi:cytochrome c
MKSNFVSTILFLSFALSKKFENHYQIQLMKKYIVPFFLAILLAACGGNDNKSTTGSGADSTATEKPAAANDITSNPDYKKGLDLISQSDCLTCHKVSEKLTGPAYKDVANKYAGSDTAVAYLVKKIIKGGKGVWGTVPMTPHPLLAEADVQQMVKYILLLKSN